VANGPKTLFVTGGAGFIGSALVRRAVAEGWRVVNIDKLTYAANLDNVASVAGRASYIFAEADIGDRSAMRALFAAHQPDAVAHLAAETHVDRSIDGPSDFIETNIVGSYALLEAARGYLAGLPAARRAAFRFLHVSTDEVYGSLGPTGVFTEQSPYAPNSPYAASKAASDMLVRAWGRTFDVPVLISNCSNNYGPYQFPEKLIPTVILNALEGRPIPVYGRGENVRDWLFVEDHARALLAILEGGQLGETYNVGGAAEARNIDLVRRLCAELDARRPRADGEPYAEQIAFVEDRPAHDFRYAIDWSKLRAALSWRPSVSLEEGLARTVSWYLDNSAWIEGVRARGFDGARLGLGGARR